MDWTPIILAVLSLIGAVLTVIVKPLIAKKLEEAHARLDAEQRAKLDYWMRIFIAAAESVYAGANLGEKKTDWVITQLINLGLDFDVDAVKAAITGLCREMTSNGIINEKE